MKYLLRYYRQQIKTNTGFFMLSILCMVVSIFILLFAYGVFQHYSIILSRNEEADSGGWMLLDFEGEDEFTKERMDRCIDRIVEQYDTLAACGNHFSYVNLYAVIDNIEYSFCVEYDRNGAKVATAHVDFMKEQKALLEGDYWTDEDEAEGNPVALDYRSDGIMAESDFDLAPLHQKEGYLTIQGKDYKIIGYQCFSNCDPIEIPYNSLDSDTLLYTGWVMLDFQEFLTTDTKQLISDIFADEFGDTFSLETSETLDLDSYYTFRSASLLVIVLAVLSGLVLFILNSHLENRMRRTKGIYRLCGMSRMRVHLLSFLACQLLNAVVCILSEGIYLGIFLPRLVRYFNYMKQAYTPGVCMLIPACYLAFTMALQFLMLIKDREGILEKTGGERV